MAEAIAIVGILSNVLQLIDCTSKIVTYAAELIKSGEDAVSENMRIESLAQRYEELGQSLSPSAPQGALSDSERHITRLGQQCRAEGTELLQVLRRLKLRPSDSGLRRWTRGLRKGIIALRKKEEIDRRRQHLHELNGVLATSLLHALAARQRLSTWEADAIASFGEHVSRDDVLQRTQRLFARHRIRHILGTLYFPQMTTRRDAIPESYATTYQWALQEKTHGLRTWLERGSGVFWISGVPGAGKSTLLKFLAESPMTRTLLEKWSNTGGLVQASYYFWYLGTPLQKSITGLLRSILYQILFANPDMASTAFPGEAGMSPFESTARIWSQSELIGALKQLACNGTQLKQRICLFIDGLDEYHGLELEIVKVIKQFSDDLGIKICVSSRPWNAFADAFETSGPNLRLEDLTRPDILKYVRGRLEQYRIDRGARHGVDGLVLDIVKKAQGVFLWVHLVVDAVIQGFGEGDSARSIRHRVQALPPDLNDFFRSILQRVHYSYRQRTHQALKLAWMFAHEHSKISELSVITDYWLMSQEPEGLANPQDASKKVWMATSGSSLHHKLQQGAWSVPAWMTHAAPSVNVMLVDTKQFIGATTKGLLTLDTQTYRVDFFHRTVYDFLSTKEVQTMLDADLPTIFQGDRVVHLLNLARLNCWVPDGYARKTVAAAAEMSIASSHPDRSFQFVRSFYMELVEQGLPPDIFATSSLPAFVAFGFADSAITYLRTPRSKRPRCKEASANNILLAVLGEYPNHKFGIKKVHLANLDRLVNSPGAKDANFDELWRVFLRKWTGYGLLICENCAGKRCPKMLKSRHVLEVAKILLNGKNWNDVLWKEPFGRGVVRELPGMKFLMAHVPGAWLRELRTDAREIVGLEVGGEGGD